MVPETPEEARAADRLRAEAFETFTATGGESMRDLDLRAAAQHAQAIGDAAAERRIDGILDRREAE